MRKGKIRKEEPDKLRRLIVFGVPILAASAIAGLYCGSLKAPHAKPDKPTFEDVTDSLVEKRDYIDFLKQDEPDIRQALQTGELSDIVLYPEEIPKLKGILLKMGAAAGMTGDYADAFVQAHLEQMARYERETPIIMVVPLSGVAITIQRSYEIFGKAIPHPIVVYPRAWDRTIKSDTDFRTKLSKHELEHVKDYYAGISVDGLRITASHFLSGDFNFRRLKLLAELRAYYKELKHIMANNINVSESYRRHAAYGYAIHYWSFSMLEEIFSGKKSIDEISQFVRDSGVDPGDLKTSLGRMSDLERKVSVLQVNAFKDLTVELDPDRVVYRSPNGDIVYPLN